MTSSIRNVKDFWTGIIYIAVGALFVFIARDYEMGTSHKMGPAYFPTVLSLLLIVIGIISLVRSFIEPGTSFGRFAFRGLLLVVTATMLFGFIVRGAGLLIALPLLVIISAYASSKFSWKTTLPLAAALTLFCILIFLKGLGVPLPVVGSWLGG